MTFEEIEKKYPEHVLNILTAYKESEEVGLLPTHLNYKPLSKTDINRIFDVIDELQPKLKYDHIKGACLFAHLELKKALAKAGYLSELVFGDVIVNGHAHMGCSLNMLKDQLDIGISYDEQKVHCWLILENFQFFDITLLRDLSGGITAGELYGFGKLLVDGDSFQHLPMLVGQEFIIKTNPNGV
ncbi:hypothetical protein [Psychromonas sp.]|uniref:hypothetical protein n=1 Tax=Psychromonas sp. TaxID=1884585 RepID=UPI003A96A5F4